MSIIESIKRSHAIIIESSDVDNLRETCLDICEQLLVETPEQKKKFNQGNLVDLIIIKPEKNNISISVIRDLIGDLFTRPSECEYKIYLIENAEKMRTEAQNAMLKSLEEPPEYVKIIMATTNVQKLLPTITSRSQIYKLGDNKEYEDIDKNGLFRIFDELLSGNSIAALTNKDFFEAHKDKKESIYGISRGFFVDMLNYKYETGNIKNIDNIYLYQKHSDITFDKIERIINKIGELEDLIVVNINYQLSIEEMLLEIAEGK